MFDESVILMKKFTKFIPYIFYFLSFLGIITELIWAEKINGFWIIYAPYMIGLFLHMKSNKTDTEHHKIVRIIILISIAVILLLFLVVLMSLTK